MNDQSLVCLSVGPAEKLQWAARLAAMPVITENNTTNVVDVTSSASASGNASMSATVESVSAGTAQQEKVPNDVAAAAIEAILAGHVNCACVGTCICTCHGSCPKCIATGIAVASDDQYYMGDGGVGSDGLNGAQGANLAIGQNANANDMISSRSITAGDCAAEDESIDTPALSRCDERQAQ